MYSLGEFTLCVRESSALFLPVSLEVPFYWGWWLISVPMWHAFLVQEMTLFPTWLSFCFSPMSWLLSWVQFSLDLFTSLNFYFWGITWVQYLYLFTFLLFSLPWWARWLHGFKYQIFIGSSCLMPCVHTTFSISRSKLPDFPLFDISTGMPRW